MRGAVFILSNLHSRCRAIIVKRSTIIESPTIDSLVFSRDLKRLDPRQLLAKRNVDSHLEESFRNSLFRFRFRR